MSDNKEYRYNEMSNKVIRSSHRRTNEDGVNYNPQTVLGQISKSEMGSAIRKEEHSQDKLQKERINEDLGSRNNDASATFNAGAYQSSTETITYHPTNAETAHIFDLIMNWVHSNLTDASHDVILSASDTILEIIKDESSASLSQSRKDIAELLDTEVLDEEFNELVQLGKRITDYSNRNGEDDEIDGDVVDDSNSLAVAFEDDNEGENEEEYENDIDGDSENVPQLADEENEDLANEAVIESAEPSNSAEGLVVPLHSIDEFYLQRNVASLLKSDPDSIAATTDSLYSILSDYEKTQRDLENELMDLFLYDHFDFIKLCVENRWRIVFKLKWIKQESKEQIAKDMALLKLSELLDELEDLDGIGKSSKKRKLSGSLDEEVKDQATASKRNKVVRKREPKIVDLDALSFDQGSHLMTATKVKLPKGSYQQKKKLYDVITIPAPEPPLSLEESGESLVNISSLPEWCQCVFPSSETTSLNRIQSKVFPLAFGNDENLLLCAPTGAGKTNVAMLAMLRTIENHRNKETGVIDLNSFKIVYIAPLKALVQEQMREFQRRLTPNFGIVVNELTGDSSLSRQQIQETQVIVTTPEKWDVITRKSSSDLSITHITKLIIVDEIHLLHDERGPVLEGIISRTLRQSEIVSPVRIVGLSATLPNYTDVATFLKVDVDSNLFYFDSSYRPCPLEQQFIGIKEKKAIKKLNAMNEACYDKVLECAKNGHQLIIFVHSRKDTMKTAKWIADKLIEERKHDLILKEDSAINEILKQESQSMKNNNLKQIIPLGFGIHHAGLEKTERLTVEDLFAQGHIQVLVSTATLAWGVNLPAHTVVIKGTETYSPEKGSWVQLSPQDILQMLGRAGRPRYDKSGEGVIITSQEEIQYYLAILNQQLPIESQLMAKLADNINAEIVLGTIKSREDAVKWLGYTYLYVRMMHSPGIYKVGADYKDDQNLYWKRVDLVHSAFTILSDNKLIIYDEINDQVRATDLGKISSHFYINYPTINMFNSKLKPWQTEIEIIRIFANAGEFKYIAIRQEEKMELVKLMEKCPIPIKEGANDPLAKVNVLLQTYISKLTLDGFALMSDMIYVTQSAGRLLRAIYEISLKKGWASLTKVALNLVKMVEKRMWLSGSPFSQFDQEDVPKEIVRATQKSHLPWMSYFTLSASELAEAVNLKGNSNKAYELLHQFPKLSFSYTAQPITPSLLRIHLEILPEWNWSIKNSGNFEPFLLMIEDCDGEKILYSDEFLVYRNYVNEVHYLDFTVPINEPMQPLYFATLISEKWLHSDWKLPLMLEDIKLPKKFPPFTEVLDLQSIPVVELKQPDFINYYSDDFTFFNKFQSQAFKQLYESNNNVFLGVAKGSGKSICAELAILNNWSQNKGRVIYINPTQELIDQKFKEWKKKFGSLGRIFNKLTGDLKSDISILNSSHVTLATPAQFDLVSRRWRQRKVIQSIELMILDDVHVVGTSSSVGMIYESIISRMKLMSSHLENSTRLVGLSTPLANGKDFAEWLGCSKSSIFNFSPLSRPNKIGEIKLQVAQQNNSSSGIDSTVINTVFSNLLETSSLDEDSRSLIFVPTRKRCIDIGLELLSLAQATPDLSLKRIEDSSIEPYLLKLADKTLKESILNGIAYYYKGMNTTDKLIVEKLYSSNVILVLLAEKECCTFAPTANQVVILTTKQYEGKEHRFVDYAINDILEMIGCCQADNGNSKVLILTSTNKLAYYQKFLNEGLPIESFMDSYFHDSFTSEIGLRTFKTRQDCVDWLTFTFYYRRLQQNPSFYGLKDTSHIGLSEYLSDLVENTLKELQEAKLVEVQDDDDDNDDDEGEYDEEDEEELTPLDGAMISGYYNISYLTMKQFTRLTNKTKLKEILEILTNAAEFESLPIRENESRILSKIYARIPVKVSNVDYDSPHFKAFILLQAHFSKFKLNSIDLSLDQKFVLEKVLSILYGCIDTLSSDGFLNALNAMDLSQMIVQGVWDRDNPLKQIPYFDNKEILERCAKGNVESVYDIMSLEDEERDQILQMSGEKLDKVAEFVNLYPNVDISYSIDLSKPIQHDEPHEITVTLNRDEEVDDLTVVSSAYPFTKKESWWVVVGDSKARQLYAINKTTIAKETQDVTLEFTIPNAGHHNLSVWCICDSYLDTDKEVSFEVDVL